MGSVANAQSDFDASLRLVPNTLSGIDFKHTDGSSGQYYVVETVVGSLATFDYDGDGLVDIYFVNGAALRGAEVLPAATNRLYRNNGDWTFSDVTSAAGLGDTGYGMGVVVGDYDNDGDPDLFLSNLGENAFYINQSDGTFTESATGCGVVGPARFGAGNSFFDVDRDGDLDLYAASYVDFDYSRHRVRTIAGHPFNTGPTDYPPSADYLYRNDGDGTFTDVSESSGVSQLKPSPGMGVLAADFDSDGDTDIFVANDQHANFLLSNDGAGVFEDTGLLAGVAFDRNGKANGNMGVEYADFDGDGLLDLFTTTYQEEMPVFYQTLEPGFLSDSTNLARVDLELNAHVSWGVGAVDFDLDGDRDLLVACGHFLENLRFIDDRTTVKVRNYLMANDGRGQFSSVGQEASDFLSQVDSSRAVALDDLDNDGDVDVVVLNWKSTPDVARVDTDEKRNRLAVQLVGTRSNRDGVDSLVTVSGSGGRQQSQYVVAGRGYESHYGSRLYFGFGNERPVSIEVRWPSARVERFECATDAVANRKMLLVEGQGIEVRPAN